MVIHHAFVQYRIIIGVIRVKAIWSRLGTACRTLLRLPGEQACQRSCRMTTATSAVCITFCWVSFELKFLSDGVARVSCIVDGSKNQIYTFV
jgi:hypothetical protein